MDIHYRLNGTDFVWDERKAASNRHKHDGVTFEQAATVFFDPLFRLVDAERNDEARDAIIGFDEAGRLLFVVHPDRTQRHSHHFRPSGHFTRKARP